LINLFIANHVNNRNFVPSKQVICLLGNNLTLISNIRKLRLFPIILKRLNKIYYFTLWHH